MWKAFPQPGYVANPSHGSVHNRGGAVDVTLVNLKGEEVSMGTEFDHFGVEAHHAYTDFPDSILANRRLLKGIMKKAGFSGIRKEWWHYNFADSKTRYPISDFETNCK